MRCWTGIELLGQSVVHLLSEFTWGDNPRSSIAFLQAASSGAFPMRDTADKVFFGSTWLPCIHWSQARYHQTVEGACASAGALRALFRLPNQVACDDRRHLPKGSAPAVLTSRHLFRKEAHVFEKLYDKIRRCVLLQEWLEPAFQECRPRAFKY